MPEISDILSMKVNKLTRRLIEIELEHSIPPAVSKDPNEKDSVSIRFDALIYYDQFSNFEINDGELIIVELPRQVDQEQEKEIKSAMNSAVSAGGTMVASTSIG